MVCLRSDAKFDIKVLSSKKNHIYSAEFGLSEDNNITIINYSEEGGLMIEKYNFKTSEREENNFSAND